MSDKYASLSPYTYCADNPVKLVDPNGEEIDDNLDKWKYNKDTKKLTWVSNAGKHLFWGKGESNYRL